jgi:hypothetical protein
MGGGEIEPVSLDDLVGAGEDRRRDRQPERLRGVEIDDQLEGGRLLDRQVGRLGAAEGPADVTANLAVDASEARPVADQATDLNELAEIVYRRNGITRRRRRELVAMAREGRGGANDKGVDR